MNLFTPLLRRHRALGLALAGLLVAFHPRAEAITIEWGTSLVSDQLFDSDGSAINSDTTHGSFKAYLGYFSSIDPTVADPSTWLSDFVVFDATDISLSTAPADAADSFSSSGRLDASQMRVPPPTLPAEVNPSSTFPAGTQAYVWIRNQDTATPTAEWALYTDSAWDFPVGDDLHETNMQWRLSTNPDTDVLGTTTANSIQTATFTAPIPEPGSASLALLAGVCLLLARRRNV